jgi:hypothetical protein
MLPRTTGAINLGPSNLRGGHKFLSLETGEIIMRRRWTEMPVPTDVVARLEEMSSDPNDSLHDYIIDKIDDNMSNDERDHSEDVGDMNKEEDEIIKEEEKSDGESEKMFVDPTFMCQENENHDHDLNDYGDIEDSSNTEYEADEREKENNKEVRDIDRTEAIAHRYNLRPNRYLYKYSFLSLHTGVKRWGDRAKDAIKDELNMLIKEKVFVEVMNPTENQVKKALMIHCFVIEKGYGRIKARALADGCGQQRYAKEETYSPTVKMESIFLNAFFDVHGGRHVVTIDIKEAF